jgi:hypothetical protein
LEPAGDVDHISRRAALFLRGKLYLTKINRKKFMLDIRNIGCPGFLRLFLTFGL